MIPIMAALMGLPPAPPPKPLPVPPAGHARDPGSTSQAMEFLATFLAATATATEIHTSYVSLVMATQNGVSEPVAPGVITERKALQNLTAILVASKPVWRRERCSCEGDYLIEFLQDARTIGIITVAHTNSIRLPGVRGEFELTDASAWGPWLSAQGLVQPPE